MEVSACVCVYVCMCVWKRLALCPPLILLSTWTMEEQLAWPSCALQYRVEERMMRTAFRWRSENRKRCTNLLIYFSICLFYLSSSLPRVTGGALLALALHLFSWLNTGTDVVERLRGPLVSLVQQQCPGAAGEDFSNQFYWSYAIGLTQQGQAQSPATIQCKCVYVHRQGVSVHVYTLRLLHR